MYVGRGALKGRFAYGPVSIPPRERLNPKNDSDVGSRSKSSIAKDDGMLPNPLVAAFSPSWHGQTYEYAAGVALKEQVLDPILHEYYEMGGSKEAMTNEPARFLSYYSKGQVVLMLHAAGTIQVGSMARVTNREGPTLHKWWDADKTLVYTGCSSSWSDWWIRRCTVFDPGCEMMQLQTATKRTLGVVYFERSVVHEGTRLTLIRGIRVDPTLNPEAIRRSSPNGSSSVPNISFPGVAAALLHHVVFASLKFGTEGVAVNSPKDDHTEGFYYRFMGPAVRISPIDGRRFFCIAAAERFSLLRRAFGEQINFMLMFTHQQLEKNKEQHDRPRAGNTTKPVLTPKKNDGALIPPVVSPLEQEADGSVQGSGEQSAQENSLTKAHDSEVAQGLGLAVDGAVTEGLGMDGKREAPLSGGTGADAVAKEREQTKGTTRGDPTIEGKQLKARISKPGNAKAIPIKIVVETKVPSVKRVLNGAAVMQGKMKRKKVYDLPQKASTSNASQELKGGIFDDPED